MTCGSQCVNLSASLSFSPLSFLHPLHSFSLSFPPNFTREGSLQGRGKQFGHRGLIIQSIQEFCHVGLFNFLECKY